MEAKKPLVRKIIETEDGSHTLYIAGLDEHYHSIHGAVQESQHVFITAGLEAMEDKPELSILEVGFGTGLNAWLTLQKIRQTGQKVHFVSIEKYPLQASEYELLNFATGQSSANQEVFLQLHQCPWNEQVVIDTNFSLTKLEMDLLNLQLQTTFDLVYFDAFAPDIQPDLWSVEIFQTLYKYMNTGGLLLTYSAKGQVRRNMQAAGFLVERLPGPPGKREMLRARK